MVDVDHKCSFPFCSLFLPALLCISILPKCNLTATIAFYFLKNGFRRECGFCRRKLHEREREFFLDEHCNKPITSLSQLVFCAFLASDLFQQT